MRPAMVSAQAQALVGDIFRNEFHLLHPVASSLKSTSQVGSVSGAGAATLEASAATSTVSAKAAQIRTKGGYTPSFLGLVALWLVTHDEERIGP